jgi:hypothetical protein
MDSQTGFLQPSPRVPRSLAVLLTLLGLHAMAVSAIERFHYTVNRRLAREEAVRPGARA